MLDNKLASTMNIEKSTNRILFITFEYGRKIGGGAGRVVNGIIPHLAEKIDVDILHIIWSWAFCRWFLHTHFLISTKHIVNKHFTTNYLKILLRLLRKRDYKIVHIIHNSKETAECIKLIRNHFPAVKIVYSCHSIAKYENNIRHAHPSHLESENYILNNIDHIHLLNESSLSFLNSSYPEFSRLHAISIIPNGIDENDFSDQNLKWKRQLLRSIKKDDIVILCMSRWSYGKGIEYLLDALPYLLAYTKKIKIIIAGRKKKSWENAMDEYNSMIDAKINPLKKHVIILNWLDDRKRNAVLSVADIWIMPSLLEYFPYSILEPMIKKIPIVSANIDPVKEFLAAGEDCLFYDAANPIGLSEKIKQLIDDKDMGRRIALSSYKKAKNMFQWTIICKAYIAMYNNLINDLKTQE